MVDLTIGGWKLNEKSAEDLAYDLENVFDDTDLANSTVILFMFGNSIFVGNVEGLQSEPVKLDDGTTSLGN